MANEDPELERIENRLTRMGMALQIIAALEIQRQQIRHRLEEKQVPQVVAERLENIINGMAENIQDLYRWITGEFEDTVIERDEQAGEKRRQRAAGKEGR